MWWGSVDERVNLNARQQAQAVACELNRLKRRTACSYYEYSYCRHADHCGDPQKQPV